METLRSTLPADETLLNCIRVLVRLFIGGSVAQVTCGRVTSLLSVRAVIITIAIGLQVRLVSFHVLQSDEMMKYKLAERSSFYQDN